VTNIDPLLTIHRITLELARTYNSEMLLEKIVDSCIELTDSKTGSLMLVNEDEQVLEMRVQRGLGERAQKEIRLKVGEGLTGMVALTGKPWLSNDVSKEDQYIQVRKAIKSELATPMEVEGQVIGVISVDSPNLDAYTDEHLRYIQILGSQAAQVFSNVKRLEQLDKQNRIQQTFLSISRLLGRTEDFKKTFLEIMEILEKELELERGMIFLFQEGSNSLELIEGRGLDKADKSVTYERGEGVIGRVFSTGEPVNIRNIVKDPNFRHKTGSRKKLSQPTSFYCHPIVLAGEVAGVLAIDKRYLSEEDFFTWGKFIEILAFNLGQVLMIGNLVAEARKKLEFENVVLKREVAQKYMFQNIIGTSLPMEKLFKMIHTVADTRANILVTGENGTGKELVASAIHYNSSRRDNPLIKINCASIPEFLLESELFGHKKGSFTGAVSDKKGKFELADGGSIFLDEIGDMNAGLQAKLLRVIQERQIEPVGGIKTRTVDVRIIAATNRDLEAMVAEGTFREDLFYRLNVIRLAIPPLRERVSDISLLCSFFINKYAQANDKEIRGIAREALKKLQTYDFPGNVRELENLIERAVILTSNEFLQEEDFDLPENRSLPAIPVEAPVAAPSDSMSELMHIMDSHDGDVYDRVIQEVERVLILNSLKKFRYVKTRTARFLGINRNTLDKKIRELNIDY
jgi:Nif-specific regulatory protein